MEKPIQVEKIINYLKQLKQQRVDALEKYLTPITLQALENNPVLAAEKIKLETEISLLEDELTAIEKLI